MEKSIAPGIFKAGPIDSGYISECLQQYSANTSVGAYSMFLGQVRADIMDDRHVAAIEYTSYEAMAEEQLARIRQELIEKYRLSGLEVVHSLGRVAAGDICLFVLAVSGHRKAAIDACQEAVERIKKELPIWGKELFAGEGHQWKVNK